MSRAKALSKLSKAFDGKLADAVKPFMLVDRKQGTYDPTTGTTSESVMTYTFRGVLSRYSDLEIARSDGQVTVNNFKMTLLSNDVSIEPETNHIIVDVEGNEYQITDIAIDPMDVAYELRLL